MHIYKVGGAVRDRLLGRPVSDIDWLVVGATVEDMHAQGFRPVGADFRFSCTRRRARSMPWRAPSARAAGVMAGSPSMPARM